MSKHICNAYCRDGLHCDLVYTDARATEQQITQVYGWHLGLRVDHCDPAREAPPIAIQPLDMLDRLSGSTGSDDRAWLVYWSES